MVGYNNVLSIVDCMGWAGEAAARIPRILVAVPHRRIFFDEAVVGSHEMQRPPTADMIFIAGSHPLDVTRNIYATHCLKGYDYLFFLDDDIVPEKDTLFKLLQARVQIVSGVYFNRGKPHQAAAWVNGGHVPNEEFGKDELLEVDAVGTGCILIHRSVFEEMGKKLVWRCLFNHTKEVGKFVATFTHEEASKNQYNCKHCGQILVANFFEHTSGRMDDGEIGSEDIVFCERARKTGFQVLVKADCYVGHLTIVKITKDGYETIIRQGDMPVS